MNIELEGIGKIELLEYAIEGLNKKIELLESSKRKAHKVLSGEIKSKLTEHEVKSLIMQYNDDLYTLCKKLDAIKWVVAIEEVGE